MSEEYIIKSKKFRNKKTGEIKTVVDILELNDYEEVKENKGHQKKKLRDIS